MACQHASISAGLLQHFSGMETIRRFGLEHNMQTLSICRSEVLGNNKRKEKRTVEEAANLFSSVFGDGCIT